MSKWYVKELSKITGLTVQALHHYDRIDLLKPSIRQANGYRLYSEADLLKVQQIMALMSFGFELAQIKQILEKDVDPIDQFESQIKILEEKAQNLLSAAKVMQSIIAEHNPDESIPWEKTIELIEVYRMSKQLEKKWAAAALSPEELKDYIEFESNLETRFSESEKQQFKTDWAMFVKEIQANIETDPKNDYGIKMGERCMQLVNTMYMPEHAQVRKIVWEKGFKGGHSDIPQEAIEWLDQAIDAYWRKRLHAILDSVDDPNNDTASQWEGIMTEMCGDSLERRLEIVEVAKTDERVSETARTWLKSHYNISS
ncbi:MAG: MerR family transcriptional regulator [Pseudomonadota bacterium]